jgi:ribonuclease T
MQTNEISKRFRGFLPVVVDVETAGLHWETDALLEIAIVTLKMDKDGLIHPKAVHSCHVLPFEGANLDPEALEITNIKDPYHPFRYAVNEAEALDIIFAAVKKELKAAGCRRAILVGHNPTFDLNFIQAAMKRTNNKKSPFHRFATFDTATLSGIALWHTVLAVATRKAGIKFDDKEAHSAIYDAEKTAELFCYITNNWKLK